VNRSGDAYNLCGDIKLFDEEINLTGYTSKVVTSIYCWNSDAAQRCGVFAVCGVTAANVPLAAIADPATTITGTSFYANWHAAPSDPHPATGFYLDVSTDPNFAPGTFVGVYNNWDAGAATTQQITGLSTGTTYHYRVRPYNGNGIGPNSNVIDPTTLSLTATASVVSNVSCFGGTNGSVTVSIGGGTAPLTFAWSTTPVQHTQTATGLPAGTYWVTVTDAAPLTVYSSTTVTEPAAPLTAVASPVTHISCFGVSNGSVTVAPSGGTSPYTFAWSTNPVQTTATATGLYTGTFYVTVTDAHGCTANSSATLTQTWWPGLSGPTPVCQNYPGNIYMTESGKTNYQWSTSAGGVITGGGTSSDHSATITWTSYGPQTVYVNYSDAGCVAVTPKSFDVIVNPAPTPVISGADVVTQGQTVIYSTPKIAGHSYSWAVSNGNATTCFPDMNCITVVWSFPCGVVNPGFVTCTETIQATGCATTVTKPITITP